ncbi:MAG: hypothetical protein FD130_1373 [Halothiobacillaceae bacterium]|nr:MAG: hypothetical protein FD130_1373 [Halothiobacillaceae bacterium]
MEVKPPPLDIKVSHRVQPTYTWLSQNVFGKICSYCHATRQPYLLVYDSIQTVVKPGKPLESRLYFMVATGQMPKGGKLSEEKKWAIYHWIKNGAKND